MTDRPFVITSAIAYANGRPHLGQAYQYILADATARFKRLDGYRVHFSSGMDENGWKVPVAAAGQGISAGDLIERTAARFVHLGAVLGLSFDRFVRTATAEHRHVCTELWQRMAESGDIYLADYAGWYAVGTDMYHSDTDTETRTDGVRVVRSTGHTVVKLEQPLHFFRLSDYRDRLLALHEANADLVGPPSRRAEVMAEIAAGLSDVPISCPDRGWGVPVPGGPGYRMHVWFDALASYLTAAESDAGRRTWPPDLQITSRGSIRFHGIHWPAFLMSAGLPMPGRIFAHGFLLSAGRRLSASDGTLPDIFELVSEYGLDTVRFFALRHGPVGLDGEFDTVALVDLANRELADGIGDLSLRCLTAVAERCRGRIPYPGEILEVDAAVLGQAGELVTIWRRAYQTQDTHGAMKSIGSLVSAVHMYLAEQGSASDLRRTDTVLYVTAEVLRVVGILLQPVVPDTARRLLAQLAISADARTIAALSTPIEPGTELLRPARVFSRIERPPAPSTNSAVRERYSSA
ncbi:methionine--tRNA ligase [Nocardia farcinica]